jgi:phage shock protein A
MARASTVGKQDFEQVTALVSGGTKVGEAISKVAADRSASRGAVSANFYAAKRRSASRPKKARRASRRRPAATPVPPKFDGSGDVDAIAAELVKNVQALADAVKAQAQEVSQLRSRLAGVKKVVG